MENKLCGEKPIDTNLSSILKKWQFPQDIIEKYESVGIVDVFEWQAECLSLNSKLGRENSRNENKYAICHRPN